MADAATSVDAALAAVEAGDAGNDPAPDMDAPDVPGSCSRSEEAIPGREPPSAAALITAAAAAWLLAKFSRCLPAAGCATGADRATSATVSGAGIAVVTESAGFAVDSAVIVSVAAMIGDGAASEPAGDASELRAVDSVVDDPDGSSLRFLLNQLNILATCVHHTRSLAGGEK